MIYVYLFAYWYRHYWFGFIPTWVGPNTGGCSYRGIISAEQAEQKFRREHKLVKPDEEIKCKFICGVGPLDTNGNPMKPFKKPALKGAH